MGQLLLLLLLLLLIMFLKQQQVQRGIWVCEHDIPGGNTQALQGLPSSTLGGFQFKKNLRSHLC